MEVHLLFLQFSNNITVISVFHFKEMLFYFFGNMILRKYSVIYILTYFAILNQIISGFVVIVTLRNFEFWIQSNYLKSIQWNHLCQMLSFLLKTQKLEKVEKLSIYNAQRKQFLIYKRAECDFWIKSFILKNGSRQ